MTSAISRISFSLTLQPNLFQLFQPITGVGASEASCEPEVVCPADLPRVEKHANRISKRKKQRVLTSASSSEFLQTRPTDSVPHSGPLCHGRRLRVRRAG